MTNRIYRVAVAKTQGGLQNSATQGWTILPDTEKEFAEMDSNDDQSLGNIGRLLVKQRGWVALAVRDLDE
ncbi:MAG: hypothetical protein NW204_03025 [Xanthomonadaceae bacterium]|nr:hypothetical protein [Xanthomonadaceae bacterium]